MSLSQDIVFPPGDIYSDEPPLESELHLRQLLLLIRCLELWWDDRQDFYVFGNLTIYYSPRQLKSEFFRGPDVFVVLGTERKTRKSWVVWEEDGKYPNVIIELLSDSTAKVDRGLKKQIYQDTFRTPEYFWFDPNTLEFQGFRLMAGEYQALQPDSQGWLWSQQLELYLGIHQRQLRFFSRQGQLLPTPDEWAEAAQRLAEAAERQAEAAERQAEAAERQAEAAQQQLEAAQQQLETTQQQLEAAQSQIENERLQKERLAEKLRELGIDLETL
ncbi:Uma2 family endonuclease [Phormidesmis sp. 146-35]